MTRRGEAWCGEVRCGGVWQGVKVWKSGFARPRASGLEGLTLLKGVDRCEIYPPLSWKISLIDRRVFRMSVRFFVSRRVC